MTNAATEPIRIANILPPSLRNSYPVPPEFVGAGFVSEVVDLAGDIMFVNTCDRTIAGLHFVEATMRAEAQGYAAAFLNTAGDYGLREARAAVNIPVVGAGQASYQIAAGLGDRFGVVTVWPVATRTMYTRLLEEYGYAERCVGVRHVMSNDELSGATETGGFISQMGDMREAAMSRIVQAAAELIDRGAESIALGCSCMSGIADELHNRTGVPVINPIVAAHKTAEMLVSMQLSHRPAPAPSGFASSMATMLGGASKETREIAASETLDMCGDTCTIISEPAAASSST